MLILLRRFAWSFLAFFVSCVFVINNLVYDEKTAYASIHFADPHDRHAYILMASSNAGSFHLAPYCWRIAVPFVAGHLGCPLQDSFMMITVVCLILSGLLIFPMLRSFGVPPLVAVIGVAFFHLTPMVTPYLISEFWMVDAAAFLFILACILAIQTRHDLVFVVLLAVGVTVKESILFTVPLYYSLRAERLIDMGRASRTLLVALPAIAVLTALHLSIAALNGPTYVATLPGNWWNHWTFSTPYTLSNIAARAIAFHTQSPLSYLLYTLSFGAFGLTLFLAFFARNSKVVIVRFLPLVLLAYLQPIFGVSTDRLVVVALPAVLILECDGIQAVTESILRHLPRSKQVA